MATAAARGFWGENDIGTLAPGKCCDLFLIDSRRLELVGACFDPKSVLATVGVRGAVDYTVVNGKITVKGGHLATIDEEKTALDAQRLRRLSRKIKTDSGFTRKEYTMEKIKRNFGFVTCAFPCRGRGRSGADP